MKAPKQSWRIDKHIPVAIIAAFVVQAVIYTGVAAWAVSKIDSRIAALEQFRFDLIATTKIRESRVQSLERDYPVIREKIESINRTTDRIEKKLDKISFNMGMHAASNPSELFFAMSLDELSEVTV